MTETQQETNDPLIGQLITGRYRVQSRIGEGGMGTVYLAVHEAIEKRIALKVLHREYSSNREVVERFQQEAISASRIKHPNVIDVFDFGQLPDGSCYIAMELLEGQDLGDLLGQRHFVEPELAVRIGLQIARALGLAHSRGVVHRDLKPENVFLQRTPEDPRVVKIVDFGIAQLRGSDGQQPEETRKRRLTKTGMIFGTPEYMAPEQARGRPVDQRTDVYAAGVILYEMLSGRVPFTGESFLDVLNQHVLDPVPKLVRPGAGPGPSEELVRVVFVALAKSPEDRFQSMQHLAQALLKTPEGKGLQRRLHGEGLSAEELTDELLSGAPPPSDTRDGRDVRTISGLPPLEEAGAPAIGDRTPPGHLLDVASPRPRSPLPLFFGVLTLALLAGGAWAWTKLGLADEASDRGARPRAEAAAPEQNEAPPRPDEPEPSRDPTLAESTPGAEAPVGDAAETTSDGKRAVRLDIETEPSGAIVHKDEFQVCDQSPCQLEVPADEPVILRASKGRSNGMARVLPQRDQKVTIVLRAPQKRPTVTKTAAAKDPPAPKTCEVMVDGLKILRPCD